MWILLVWVIVHNWYRLLESCFFFVLRQRGAMHCKLAIPATSRCASVWDAFNCKLVSWQECFLKKRGPKPLVWNRRSVCTCVGRWSFSPRKVANRQPGTKTSSPSSQVVQWRSWRRAVVCSKRVSIYDDQLEVGCSHEKLNWRWRVLPSLIQCGQAKGAWLK
jgi:hypothetical protein